MSLLAVGVMNAQSSDGATESCTALLERASKLGPSELIVHDSATWLAYEDRVSRQPLRAAMGYINDWSDLLSACGVEGIVIFPRFRGYNEKAIFQNQPRS